MTLKHLLHERGADIFWEDIIHRRTSYMSFKLQNEIYRGTELIIYNAAEGAAYIHYNDL